MGSLLDFWGKTCFLSLFENVTIEPEWVKRSVFSKNLFLEIPPLMYVPFFPEVFIPYSVTITFNISNGIWFRYRNFRNM